MLTFNPVHPNTAQEVQALERSKSVVKNVETVLADVRAQDQRLGVDMDPRQDIVVLSNTDVATLVGRESSTFTSPPGNPKYKCPTDPVFRAEKNLSAVSNSAWSLDAQGGDLTFQKSCETSWLGFGEQRLEFTQTESLPNMSARWERVTQYADSGKWAYESKIIDRRG